MVDRRRQSRPLSKVPQTELEVLWEIRERVAAVETALSYHIEEHEQDKKARASARALVWTNVFVVTSIMSSVVLHYLPAK